MSCNHATGQCDEGCAAGWSGTLCDKGRTCYFTEPFRTTFQEILLFHSLITIKDIQYLSIICMITECDDVTYGYDCLHNCSGHCLNDVPCNKQNGHCEKGCKPGYTTDNCSKGKFIDNSAKKPNNIDLII